MAAQLSICLAVDAVRNVCVGSQPAESSQALSHARAYACGRRRHGAAIAARGRCRLGGRWKRPTIKASCRNFQGSLEPLEWCQMAPTSMKELSIRYMELFRTSLDTIHTYGTHVNMSISVQRSAETVLKLRSARRPRSSHRPIHWKPSICACGSRRARNAQLSNEANPVQQSHKRNRGRWPPKLR